VTRLGILSYNRIIVIGNNGSGKSYLSKELSAITGLPLIHLDVEFWKPNWVMPTTDEWIKKQRDIVSKEKWIIDGNHCSTMELRFKTADLIIFLDFNRFVCLFSLLKRNGYDASRIGDMDQLGKVLWQNMANLPEGFCHGDLHTGNMILNERNEYVLFDFDVCALAYPLIDVATPCDASNFNVFDEAAYDRTARVFDRFYRGYSQARVLTEAEISALYDFIAIRHYEIIATIVETRGETLDTAFMDEQYGWLMDWKNLCDKKRA
jgi:hypothetical protein